MGAALKTSKVRLLEEPELGTAARLKSSMLIRPLPFASPRAVVGIAGTQAIRQFPRVVDPVEIVVLEKRVGGCDVGKIKRGRTLRAAEDLEVAVPR